MPRGIPNCPTCHKPMKHARGELYYCQNDEDRPHKNAFCDHLMKVGIDGRLDEDVVTRIGLLTDLAVELGRNDSFPVSLPGTSLLSKRPFVASRRLSLI